MTKAWLLVLLLASQVYAEPVVATDRENYSPGDVVVVTGTGWTAGETIRLSYLQDDNVDPIQVDTVIARPSDKVLEIL